MNTFHGPVFINSEVNPASLFIYSEHRLDDIHCNVRGAHCEGNVLYFVVMEFMAVKLREALFLFLAE